jgi:glycosyltransferase involved in cell wall biosynthesis
MIKGNENLPVLSLIVPTLGRTRELKRFLDSVKAQDMGAFLSKDVEVIVVDQNGDDRLDVLVKSYGETLTLHHLKILPKGLSNARNAGLATVRGKHVGFPDDDCFYAPDILAKVLSFFKETDGKWGLFIRCMDPMTQEDFLHYPKVERAIHSPWDSNVFLGISISQFHPLEAVRAVGGFDEDFGIGGVWGSGEETDLSIRLLRTGLPIRFRPDIVVFHDKTNPLDLRNMPREKVRSYARGFGALCRKHRLHRVLFLKAAKQAAGVLLFALKMDLRRSGMCWTTLAGRLEGYWGYDGPKSKGASV